MGVDWNQLGGLFTTVAQNYAKPGSPQSVYAQQANDQFQAAQMARLVRKQEEEEEKKKKAGLFGSIGSALGTIGGVALAPLTGGTSLAIPAALGAAGGAVGGSVGRAVGGGGFDPQATLMDAGMGAAGGFMGGYMGGFNHPASMVASRAPTVTPGRMALSTMPFTGLGGFAGQQAPMQSRFAYNPQTGRYEYMPVQYGYGGQY